MQLAKSCHEARLSVQGDGVIDVWLWQLSPSIEGLGEQDALYEIGMLEVRS